MEATSSDVSLFKNRSSNNPFVLLLQTGRLNVHANTSETYDSAIDNQSQSKSSCFSLFPTCLFIKGTFFILHPNCFLKIWNRISGAILELLSNDRDGNYFAERGISNSSYSSSSYTNGSLGSSSPGPSPSFPIGQASSGMHLNYKNEYLVRALLRHQLLSREYAVKLLMPRETGFIE